jgi:hypothetical protein
MECGDHAHTVDVEELAAQFRNRDVGLKQVLGGKCAEATYDFRSNDGQLPFEKRIARQNLVGLRVPVIRRTALQDIADVDVITSNAPRVDGGVDNLRQQLTGAANEWNALLIFVGTWRFADKHKFGIDVAGAKDNVCARRGQLAALAVSDVFADDGERVCHGSSWFLKGKRRYSDSSKEFELLNDFFSGHGEKSVKFFKKCPS